MEILSSQDLSEKLERRAKTIDIYVRALTKGAAEHFGYAYLAGHELLLAKDDLPHGNTADRSSGFMRWAQQRFKRIDYRTCTRWMEFAREFNESKEASAFFKKHPLLLVKGKLTVKDRSTILQAVPMILDGKGMMKFMRDCRLLRDPLKPKHHPRKKIDPEAAKAARLKLAQRHWTNVVNAQNLGEKLLRLLDRVQLQSILDRNVATNDLCRTFLKAN